MIETFVVDPVTIQEGQLTRLRWRVTDATEVSILPSIGSVAVADDYPAFPSRTTEYMLEAKGPGGTATATVKVTVSPATLQP